MTETNPANISTIYEYDSLGNRTSSTQSTFQKISTFEPDETWSAGTSDTVHFKEGDQGLKLTYNGSIVTTSRNVNLDLALGSEITDYIDIWVYIDVLDNFWNLDLSFYNGATKTTKRFYPNAFYGSNNGWKNLHIPKSDFSMDQAFWSNITKLEALLIGNPGVTVNVTLDDWRVVNNKKTTYTYDALNRLTSSKDPLDKTTTYEYDANGNQTKVIDPNGKTTTNQYDALNRTVKTTDPLSNTVSYSYDKAGNRFNTIDSGGTTTSIYGQTGLLLAARDQKGNVTKYTYDSTGNQTSIIASDGTTVTNVYNLLDQLISVTEGGGTKTYTYDEAGNKLTETDPSSNVTAYTYDKINRIKSVTDANNKTVNYEYDGNSNQTKQIDPNGTITYGYDAINRLISVNEPSGRTTTYDFFNHINQKRVTDTNGTITYSYNKGEYLTKLEAPSNKITTFDYNANNQRILLTNANNTRTSYNYDDALRTTSVSAVTSTNSPVFSESYTYDGKDNKLTVNYGSNTISYEYDKADQLTKVVATSTTTYQYDTSGNRTTMVDPVGTTTYNYNSSANQLTNLSGPTGNIAFTYDTNGNLKTKTDSSGTTTYTWDNKNQLTAVSGPGISVSFTYNNQGKRASKTENSQTINYFYDGNKLIAEKDNSGNLIAAYIYDEDNNLISMTKNNNNYYFHLNDRKDVIKITDESQNIVASYEYDVWGNIISSSGSFANQQPFRYASYHYDSSTQLYYLINRYYDPGIGRFISKDKFRRQNSDSLDLNPYLYVRNNPVNKTDSDGYGTLDNKRLATVWLARPDLQAAFPRVNPNNYNGANEADWGRLETWAKNLSDSGAKWVMSEAGAIPPDVDPNNLGTAWNQRSDLQGAFPSIDPYRHTGADWNRFEDWARDNWNKDSMAYWVLTHQEAPNNSQYITVNEDRLGTAWVYRSDLQTAFPNLNPSTHTGSDWNKLVNWAQTNHQTDSTARWVMGVEGGIEPVASDSFNSSNEETSDEGVGYMLPDAGTGNNTTTPFLPAHPTPVYPYKKVLKSRMHVYYAGYWVADVGTGTIAPKPAAYRSQLFVTVDYYERETVVRAGDFWDTSALTTEQMLYRTIDIYTYSGFKFSYNRSSIRGGYGSNALDNEPEVKKTIYLIPFGRPNKVTLTTSVIAHLAEGNQWCGTHKISLYF